MYQTFVYLQISVNSLSEIRIGFVSSLNIFASNWDRISFDDSHPSFKKKKNLDFRSILGGGSF